MSSESSGPPTDPAPPTYPAPGPPTYPALGENPLPPYPVSGDGRLPSAPPAPGIAAGWTSAPRAMRPVVVLLLVNLTLSVLLTVVTLIARHSVVNYQLDHRHITDPRQRELLRETYSTGIVTRVLANIVVSVVYVFLVRALLRGRRWAYRRVIVLGAIGIVGLVVLRATPYPVWMRAEQLVQALVLAGLLYFVLRPEVKAHFDPALPGRTARRFER